MKLRLFATLILVALLSACGSNTKTTTATKPGEPLDPQGNWLFTMNGASGSTYQFAGQLFEITEPVVTSNALPLVDANPALCRGQITAQGQASGTNTINLTVTNAATVPTQTLSLTGTIANSQQAMSGTWTTDQTAAYSCVPDLSGTWSAQELVPVTGSWSGTESNGSNVTASLTENTDQTSVNMGQVTGTITFSSTACFAGPLTLTTGTPYSVHVGETLNIVTNPDANGASLTATGTVTTDGKSIMITGYTVSGGACNGLTGTASLAVQ